MTDTATMPDLCYLDSSGLVKLAVPERESNLLSEFLERYQRFTSSALDRVEVTRNVARHGYVSLAKANELLEEIYLIDISDAILEAAIRISPSSIRTLDAIHLASALSLRDALASFVTYDRRMREAGLALGLPVESPE